MLREISLEEWDIIVSSIYEAALVPEKWDELLVEIGKPIDSHASQITAIGDRVMFQRLNSSHGHDSSIENEFQQEVKEGIHTRVNFVSSAPVLSVVTDYMHSSERQMATDPFYQGSARHYDVPYYGAVVLERSEAQFTVFASFRDRKRGHYESRECQYLTMIAPHLRRSLELMRHTRLKSVLGDSDIGATGMIVLDNKSKIVSANSKAMEILNRQDGIFDRGKQLRLSDRNAQKLLEVQLHSLLSENMLGTLQPLYIRVETLNTCQPLYLMVAPLTREIDRMAGFSAVVTIVEPEEPSRNPIDSLVQLYGLTRKEAQIVALLWAGLSLTEIAEKNGLSRETPRFHLKNIYSKTNVKSQSELMRMISDLLRLNYLKL